MFRGICIALALGVFSFGWCTEDGGGQVRMSLEARDLVVGEISIMGDRALTLRVENHGTNTVRLPTGGSSRWMVDSRCWKVHIDGPVDSRCEESQAVVTRTLPVGGRYEETIGAGEEKRFNLPGLGIGQEGEYRVWVEYRGDLAREDELRDVLRTDEVVLRIGPPTATEEEVVRNWRAQNPNTPWCLFPAGVDSDLADPVRLIKKHPTSIYAGWALWGRLKSHLGGFNGPPSVVEPEAFLEAIKNPRLEVVYPETLPGGSSGRERALQVGEAAAWRRDAVQRFLGAHPEFPYAAEMRLRVAMDYLGLGSYVDAAAEFERASATGACIPAAARAREYLSLMEAHNMLSGTPDQRE